MCVTGPVANSPRRPASAVERSDVELVVTRDIAGIAGVVEDPGHLVGQALHIRLAPAGMGEYGQRIAQIILAAEQCRLFLGVRPTPFLRQAGAAIGGRWHVDTRCDGEGREAPSKFSFWLM